MRVLPAEYLRDVGVRVFRACGASPEEAFIVADHLVEASLRGLDSHGVMRYVQYAQGVLEGKIKPGAPIRVVKETPTTAIVDCGFNFGPVGAIRMVDIVCEKATQADLACVVSQNGNHVGRLGAYVQKIAERDLFGFATVNSSKHGHFVVPWGGREGRLATNPLAYAVLTNSQPVVMDMSTSMISEGEIRALMLEGKAVPPGCIQDADGNPTIDPKSFYGPPRGTILPFGAPERGYRGFGLALLVELLSGIMAGMASSADHPYVNGLCLLAINPAAFCGLQRFKELMDDLIAYITATPPAPGFREVVMPGTLSSRMRQKRLVEGIPLPDQTWQLIVQTAERLGVAVTGREAEGQ